MISDRAVMERPGERAGIALIMAALALIAGELWHPEPPHMTDQMLQMIAANGSWPAIHVLQIIGASTFAFGLVEATALAGSAAQLRVAVFAILGGALLIAALALDGIAFKEIAGALTRAPGTDRNAIETTFAVMLTVQGALLNVGALFLFGMATCATGGIIARTGHARIAARTGQVIGAVVGMLALIQLDNTGLRPLPWYPFAVLLVSLWALWMGIMLWRKRGAAIADDTSPRIAA